MLRRRLIVQSASVLALSVAALVSPPRATAASNPCGYICRSDCSQSGAQADCDAFGSNCPVKGLCTDIQGLSCPPSTPKEAQCGGELQDE